ncbi:MAG: hypothetical protein FWH22_04755 [Fibromonadales bacterium]|nr:hypothetical protein [Fibromonadales bacterium]
MNIYDFFNSPDVAEYCQSIGHTFNALESAVMASQSNARTLAEKHEAYRTIIAEYPDMEIPEAFNHEHIKSFSKALEDVIEFERQLLEKFLLPEQNAIYQVTAYYTGERESYEHSELFSTYKKAYENTMEWHEGDDHNLAYMRINKRYLNNKNYVSAKISKAGEILKVDQCNVLPQSENSYLLEHCYIDVPVPFKRGDLVEEDNGGYMGGVYVIQNIIRDNPKQNTRLFRDGDISDMTAWVFYEHNGSVECECMHFYPDLRYCRRELEGKKRILKYISHYMQDKFCLCALFKAQEYLLLNEKISGLKKSQLKYQLEQLGDGLI